MTYLCTRITRAFVQPQLPLSLVTHIQQHCSYHGGQPRKDEPHGTYHVWLYSNCFQRLVHQPSPQLQRVIKNGRLNDAKLLSLFPDYIGQVSGAV